MLAAQPRRAPKSCSTRRARRDAQARRRPHRPHRDRIQRHLHHQARRRSSPCRSSSRAGTTPKSVTNLADPDDLPLRYAQVMTIAVIYPRDAEECPDARARRRLDLDLSRPLHAGRRDRHGRDRPRRDQRRQDLFRPARDRRACAIATATAASSSTATDQLRPDPGRRLSRRLRAVPSADQGVLHAGQAAARAGRRRRLQRPRRHQALCLDRANAGARCFRRSISIRPAPAR